MSSRNGGEPGFARIEDSEEMRAAIIIQGYVNGSWSQTFSSWGNGPVVFRSGRDQRFPKARENALHEEVANRVLDPSHRRHYRPHEIVSLTSSTTGQNVLEIGALEVLRVDIENDDSPAVLLVVHTRIVTKEYAEIDAILRGRRGREAFGKALCEIIGETASARTDSLVLGRDRPAGRWVSRVFTVTWVPHSRVDEWEKLAETSDGEAPAREPVPVPVSDHVMGLLGRGSRIPVGADLAEDEIPVSALVAGWQWAARPRTNDIDLGGRRLRSAQHNTHVLSQNWAVTLSEYGAAYQALADDPFIPHAMLDMCTTHLDIYLLVLVNRVRLKALSRGLGMVAERLRTVVHAAARTPDPKAVAELDEAINDAVSLDSEAVLFLAGEWWADVTDQVLADDILRWMQEVDHLSEAVDQVVSQTHLLRDSVQNLIELQEQRVDRERQASTRVMEKALAVLTFIGMPLTVMLEIWVNWDTGGGLASRGPLSWAVLAIGVIGGAVLLGMFIAWAVFRIGPRSLFGRD